MSGVGSWSRLLEVEWRHVQRWDQIHHMHRSVNYCCESHERAICKYDRSPLFASICLIPCGSSDAIYVGLVLNASALLLAMSITTNPANRWMTSWMNSFLETPWAMNYSQNLSSILVPSLTPRHRFWCTTIRIKPNYNHILCLLWDQCKLHCRYGSCWGRHVKLAISRSELRCGYWERRNGMHFQDFSLKSYLKMFGWCSYNTCIALHWDLGVHI